MSLLRVMAIWIWRSLTANGAVGRLVEFRQTGLDVAPRLLLRFRRTAAGQQVRPSLEFQQRRLHHDLGIVAGHLAGPAGLFLHLRPVPGLGEQLRQEQMAVNVLGSLEGCPLRLARDRRTLGQHDLKLADRRLGVAQPGQAPKPAACSTSSGIAGCPGKSTAARPRRRPGGGPAFRPTGPRDRPPASDRGPCSASETGTPSTLSR